MRLALYQPDIPPNAGTMLRLAACMGIAVDLIEPCGFPFGARDRPRDLRRAGMDYLDRVVLTRHASWPAFLDARQPGRLILLTTRAESAYTGFRFAGDDILLVGRESAGVPAAVHAVADARVSIPMAAGCRSLNVAVAAAMVLGEALRQAGRFPGGAGGEATP